MRLCAPVAETVLPLESLNGVFTNLSYVNDAQHAKLMEFRYVWFLQGSIRELSEFSPRQREALIILGATWLKEVAPILVQQV